MIKTTEIAIVGAGPSGLIAGHEAAKKGADVSIFEEHNRIGFPCHCAGLLSAKGLEELNIPIAKSFVQNGVRGAKFFSPSGLSFTVERKETMAYVVDRSLFDNFLAREAIAAGARILPNSCIRTVNRTSQPKAWVLDITKNELWKAKVLIDAKGASPRILGTATLKGVDPAHMLSGFQIDFSDVNVDQDYVEIHTGTKIAPKFFAWVIPTGKNSARVGLACKGVNPRALLDAFLRKRFGEEKKEPFVARSGLVVTGGPVAKTFDDGLLVVGDAAGQVKPTTGGGVVLGGICATFAGQVASEAIIKDKCSSSFLRKYENLWKDRLGKEFRATHLSRRILNNLSDKTLDKLFRLIIDANLQEELSTNGDIDFQSTAIMKLFRKKEIYVLLPSFLRALSPFRNE